MTEWTFHVFFVVTMVPILLGPIWGSNKEMFRVGEGGKKPRRPDDYHVDGNLCSLVFEHVRGGKYD